MKSFTTATIAMIAMNSAVLTVAHGANTTAAHGSSTTAAHSSACTAESLKSAKDACDSIADVSQLKCDDKACHDALHILSEDETRQCYVSLGLGPSTDLNYYDLLDDFCHDGGPDPATAKNASSPALVDHDHDHDDNTPDHDDNTPDHDHDDDDDKPAASSSTALTVARSLVVLQLVAFAAVTILA